MSIYPKPCRVVLGLKLRRRRLSCKYCISVVQVHTGRQPGSSSVIVSVGLQGEGRTESWHSETSSCWWIPCTDCIYYHGWSGTSSSIHCIALCVIELSCCSSLLANSRVERCRTDDLMPNVPASKCVDPTVQGLKVIIDCPEPGSSWATYRPPPLGKWSKCGGNDTMMVLLQARCPKKLSWSDLTQPNTGEQVVMLRTVSLVVCLVYGIHKIFCRHQVLKASRYFAGVLVMVHV